MDTDDSMAEPQFGFFSVVALGGGTLVGGYLILNALGRPVEFHCTEAVKPTRAQEILYGPTLSPFLYAEQLGRSLVAAAKIPCKVIFTDSEHGLDLRRFAKVPVFVVGSGEQSQSAKLTSFRIGENQLYCLDNEHDDRTVLDNQDWAERFADWDLSEPFSRIRDAIAETQKAA